MGIAVVVLTGVALFFANRLTGGTGVTGVAAANPADGRERRHPSRSARHRYCAIAFARPGFEPVVTWGERARIAPCPRPGFLSFRRLFACSVTGEDRRVFDPIVPVKLRLPSLTVGVRSLLRVECLPPTTIGHAIAKRRKLGQALRLLVDTAIGGIRQLAIH
jgi:hypothetical protein